ncbi:probable receptor-like protein kinase At1g49730 [Dioscorea cayenensis subsp. rotundata]|uniref:Probable receptor-like protein kinase At1g49730 n=1 Tax=Dioscorea cayennensis subsp. rotundata TaxID=55577 RepID=A0AB40CHA5_DIOCR|nr:probable receptor-like protein kinase At1g49730 [Dioscorea cayenensis subsp. rotundata]
MPLLLLFFSLFLVTLLVSSQLTVGAGDCPLDFSWSNLTLAASTCSNRDERAQCCRYINAFVAVSVAHYANATGKLGVPSAFSDTCLDSVSQTLELNGVPPNATAFCGLGPKIRVSYQCEGRETVLEMLQSPNFSDVIGSCKMPLSLDTSCKRCLNSGINYLHHLIGAEDNVTLSICRNAAFVALASQGDNMLAVDMSSCFFGVKGLSNLTEPSSPYSPAPAAAPISVHAQPPIQHLIATPPKEHHKKYSLTLIPGIGIAVIVIAILLLLILIFLIRKKSRELESADINMGTSWNAFPPSQVRKCSEGTSPMFRRFSYKETKKATNSFSTVLGSGGFGTVYRAQFSDGSMVAVKRMNKVSRQGEEEFCREMELLGRLHHRHLVALKGFCVDRQERFLMYEYMENGSLKDHLHSPGRNPLRWRTRLQIAIDVANALEYLHFYCDPSLCHRDIKSSNILLDENFVAKVADFGLAHASRSGAISFEPVNTDIRGTPGYMDPEYVVTQELTEKSDIYSYGVLLLELVTGRKAIQDNKNLVEWAQKYMTEDTNLHQLVDSTIAASSIDFDQLQTVVEIIQWCTQKEGRARPSIKQVLRVFSERLDPVHNGFAEAFENGQDVYSGGQSSKMMAYRSEFIYLSGDARCLQSSSSTTRSYCSRSVLLETGSPQSPSNVLSV